MSWLNKKDKKYNLQIENRKHTQIKNLVTMRFYTRKNKQSNPPTKFTTKQLHYCCYKRSAFYDTSKLIKWFLTKEKASLMQTQGWSLKLKMLISGYLQQSIKLYLFASLSTLLPQQFIMLSSHESWVMKSRKMEANKHTTQLRRMDGWMNRLS